MREPLVRPAPAMYRINVTPIIDVALVLVIILLVTAPLMSVADMDVTLPSARTRDVREADKILVTIDAHGGLAIHEDLVSPDDFRALLGEYLADLESSRDAVVVIRADQGLSHGLVSLVVEEARLAGAVRVAIATQTKVVDSR